MSTKLSFIVAGVIVCGCSQRPLDLPGAAASVVADLGAADLAPSSAPPPTFDLASPGAAPADLATALGTGDLASTPRDDMARATTGDMATVVCTHGLRLPSVPLVQPSYPAERVASADFDGDGSLDLVASGGSDLDVILGNGDGTFKPLVRYGALGVNFVTTDDFNGDGKPDILVVYTTILVALNQGDGTFDRNTLTWFKGIPVGGLITQATTGDFNHDGKRDIAAAAGDHVIVALGNGDGTFAPIVKYPTGPVLNSVLVGDLDGDGNADLVAVMEAGYSSSPGSGDLGIVLGRGDGTFGGVVHYGAPSNGGSGFGALGDVNNDGKLDVLATDYKSNLVSVFLGNGDGTLKAPTTFAANSVAHTNFGSDFVGAIDVKDFNGDGKLDIVTTEPSVGFPDYDNFVNVSLGHGDGTFQAALRVTTNSAPTAFMSGDFDGDGKLDLVTSGYDVGVVLGKGDGTFRGPDRYQLGDSPSVMTTGDFNGDGNLDLAVSTYNGSDSTIKMLLGTRDGRFTVGGASPTGTGPSAIVAADLDGDGKLDLVVTNGYVSASVSGNSVSVLFGNGDGGFAAPITHTVGGQPEQVAVADLDGNGALDIVTADYETNTVSVLLGRGKGAFAQSVQYAAGDMTSGVTIGDFNRDGKLDIAASGYLTLVSLLGNGDGTFAKGVRTGPDAPYGGTIVSADFNGDGKLDIAVGGYPPTYSLPLYGVLVSLGKGDGTFSQGVIYAVDGNGVPEAMAMGDVNGDGKLDILTVSNTNDDVSVLLGKGDGTFSARNDYAAGWRPMRVTTGDFNHDGKLDLATIASGEALTDGEVNILLNHGCR